MKRAVVILLLLGSIPLFFLFTKTRPTTAPPHADILIFSPHPDDAALCCAGVIQNAIRDHKTVLVVDITNGDDFASAAAKLFSKSQTALSSSDMIRFAEIRQKEEQEALNMLDVPNSNIIFLAFPDGILDEVYGATTPRFHTLTNTYTTYSAHVPDYHSARYRKQASYTKLSVMADITEIIRLTNPSEIYVTSDTDTAMDHVVTYKFVTEAAQSIKYQGKLFTYLIHGTTPLTRLASESVAGVALTPQEMTRKHEALATYKTQFLMGDFPLFSFVKPTEDFWRVQ